MQAVDQVTNMIGNIPKMQSFPTAISGIKNFKKIFHNGPNHLVTRQRTMSKMIDRANLRIGCHHTVGQFRKLFFEAHIGRHRNLLSELLKSEAIGPATFDSTTVNDTPRWSVQTILSNQVRDRSDTRSWFAVRQTAGQQQRQS